MAGNVVAYLEVVSEGRGPNDTQSDIEIRGSEQFYLGRHNPSCRQSWLDPFISNKHLRIHCIIYEQDPNSTIPPSVYATDISTNGTYIKKSNAECASSQGKGMRMGRDATFLLDEGDELRLSNSVTLIYHSLKPVRGVNLPAVQQREQQLFSSRYLITDRVLGVGGYGKVLVGIRQETQRQVACKVIDLRRFCSAVPPSTKKRPREDSDPNPTDEKTKPKLRLPGNVSKYFREFDVLKDLSHPNIIAVEKVFWSTDTIYIFQDLVTGGDLYSYVEYKGGRLNDIETAVIIRQVLMGIQYLHGRDIVHRDLKPDNILMTGLEDGARIVITDFGHARQLPADQDIPGIQSFDRRRMYSYVGTLEYAAPEIHKSNKAIPRRFGYSTAVDMWSIGVITGTLLSGATFWVVRHPLHSDKELRAAVLSLSSKCDLTFMDDRRDRIWRNVGSKPKDFIRNLVVLNEENRMSANEALLHPWFTNSYHLATFDAVYENSIRDWRPRCHASSLVEPISQISPECAESVVSDKFLTQEVVSRYFAPPRQLSSSGKYGNHVAQKGLLPGSHPLSIKERLEAACTRPEQQSSPRSYNPIESVYFDQEDMGQSIHTFSVPVNTMGKYAADDDARTHEEPLVAKSSDDVYAGFDSIYNFSIPNPPPHTPEVERDSVLVPETPVEGAKRHREQVSYGLGTSSKVEDDPRNIARGLKPSRYARLLSKRAKIRH